MRIALFCHNYPPHPGGLEVIVERLASGLGGGHEVVVVTTAWGDHGGVAVEGGVEVHRLGAIHASESAGVPYPVPWRPFEARRALDAAAAADIVHVHGALYATTTLGFMAARRRRRPVVLTEHVGFVDYPSRLLNATQAAAWAVIGDRHLASSARLTAYNDRVRAWLERRAGRPVSFVANGVDCRQFRPMPAEKRRLRAAWGLPPDVPLALFAGRDAPKKRLDLLLGLDRRGYRLVVCGAERGLDEPGVVDLGLVPRERMSELLAACDLLVHPSTGEGFPLAVQEAMAAGLPVVLRWDEGYARSLDRDVVVPVDDDGELPGVIERLAGDAAVRSDYARRAREWAEGNWDWTATVSRYVAIYDEVLGPRRS